jgi:Mrr N-terminal domain
MPTIEIDTDVYDALKTLAVPFEDTPNSVLRRELKLGGRPASRTARGGPTRAQRATVGSILPEREYEIPILRALVEAEGSASASDVTDRVGELLGSRLTQTDREANRSGEVRWRNRAAFARLRLVERGLLLSSSRRGLWEISPAGREALDART